jgi:hypothetical protein
MWFSCRFKIRSIKHNYMANVVSKLITGMEAAWEAGVGRAKFARMAVARIEGRSVDLSHQRAAARQLLAELLVGTFGPRAADWEIGRLASGAPAIERAAEDVAISLGHSGPWVVAGLGKGSLIGVDIEQARPGRRTEALADFIGWDVPPGDEDGFYRRWTIWEALLKSRGGEMHGPGVESLLEGGADGLCGFCERPADGVFCALVLQSPPLSTVRWKRLDPKALRTW